MPRDAPRPTRQSASYSSTFTASNEGFSTTTAPLRIVVRNIGRSSMRSGAFWKSIEPIRSEEHTSELQSPMYLVCRLLLEKKMNLPIVAAQVSPGAFRSAGHAVQCQRFARRFARLPADGAQGCLRGFFFFFNDPATPELYPLPLRAPLPI